MNENYLVTKANTLITSNYDLSLEEQRVILTLASTVQPNDEDFKPYNFSIKYFMELLGVEDKRKYSKIPKITKELMKKVLEIKQGDDILQVAWLSSAYYRKGTGSVELEFSPRLKPFMLGLKDFYTSYRLKNILELKGKYSIRMYEILKSNEFKKNAIIKIDELRKVLKADKGSYLINQNFKNRIIIQAQKELKDKTDIYFDFEEIKTGRKVTSIRFYIYANSNKVNADEEVSVTELEEQNPIEKIINIMSDHKITTLEARKIYDSSKGNVDVIYKVYNHFKNKEANNFIGLLIDQVRPGVFKENKKNHKKDSSNDFLKHGYTAEECIDIERKLLGN